MHEGRFRLCIKKDFFTKEIVKHRQRLPREAVQPPFLEVFKGHADVALLDMVHSGGLGSVGFMVEG